VTVLREGRVVTSGRKTQTLTQGDLVRLMVGRELTDVYALGSGMGSTGDVVLQVSHLACPPQVREGEIVSLAGLVGAGRSETLEAIFRLRRATGGEVKLHGQHFIPRTPREAILAGVGLIPEDRRRQGVVPDFSVRENLLLAHRGPGRVYAARREKIRALLALLDLPERRMLDANLLTFSGGMQQKIILARWLLLEPRLVLLDEPTRGVDIGTRASIYAFVTPNRGHRCRMRRRFLRDDIAADPDSAQAAFRRSRQPASPMPYHRGMALPRQQMAVFPHSSFRQPADPATAWAWWG
jgi:ABC-type sugar transport system ATPase subunit